ncbi:aspartate kinase [Rubrivirga litoralis]|uniref:Aspartate kinase n=1 Tax=Rubrivirga litoralis TaxID=3075598 RepID=A0ABU3BV65_9BACT|nr:aspartate kinase [Rubrivirga sp. F394]MDT0633182.1 aspartate kinase [Rubrivirga sp. F394]
MPDRPVHVDKFGGTSVATPERVRRVVEIVAGGVGEGPRGEGAGRRVVVTSAFGGVTDRLLDAVEAAVGRTGAHREILAALRARHADALAALAPESERDALGRALDTLFVELGELLYGMYLLRECTPRFRDAIVSAGERAAVPLVAAAFRAAGHAAVALDATAFVRTDDAFGEAAPDLPETRRLARAALAAVPADAVAVVTGFVGSTADGVTTTLGRSGSDYTATLLAGALDAAACVIWTDVDGVLSADPRVVPEAFPLEHLSYAEAAELAHFGAKVLHPRTMRPLVRAGIPLQIKNTLRPEAPGTRVGPAPPGAEPSIRAVTAIRGAALVRVEGAAVLDVADLGRRVLAPLADGGVPVSLVAQASAEGSFGLAVREADADAAVRLLSRALAREVERGDVFGVRAEGGGAVVAAVGSGMHGATGLAGRFFHTLARAHVPVRAVAQGGGDHTISAVVADADAARAVGALHEAFALRRLRAHVVVVGAGALGRRVLALLGAESERLRAGGLHLVLAGVADSRRLAWEPDGLHPAQALDALAAAPPAPGVLDALTDRLAAARLERLVVVDATPSADVAARHAAWLAGGAAVVTPNKEAAGRSAAAWGEVQRAARDAEAPYLYEAAVGAGLGVVARLRDLVRTGDRVLRVEGVLSGTLAFVMNRMRDGAAFSAAVAAARDAGLTEPDVRDDLSGRDAARKLALLAREVGLDVAAADVAVEGLAPPALADVPLAAFWDRLPEADADWQDRPAPPRPPASGAEISAPDDAPGRGGELQYVARLDADGSIRAGVEAVAPGSPFAGLQGAEIAVAVWTERGGPRPLVLRGPGASADVTAAVVLADVVRAAEAMR